ncbi:hypothetical protein pEaSNUABM13_00064 [Erwinia phage pEa_SNUABM_13]|nr:hypothetical protein pEaSNUABM13_00064 [Erwinia phage pEa_SNUABM_13]QYW03364.1 hypothetical protein pEaSNUABM34_00062 [Erwinia phage pEa_SNUABM_34]QYW05418.1 hypothetical protein pEaSNUABM25_00062 [Erwinia phage pEa_SNUABM_25]
MEKNLDKKIIVLDIDRFAQLLALASVGDQELCGQTNLEEIIRHVRKFNPVLKAAQDEEQKEERERRKAAHRERAKANRILTNRTVHSWPYESRGCGTFEQVHKEEPRVFYYLYDHEKLAFPVHVLGPSSNAIGLLCVSFLTKDHIHLAGQYFIQINCPARSIAERLKDIPEGYTLMEVE